MHFQQPDKSLLLAPLFTVHSLGFGWYYTGVPASTADVHDHVVLPGFSCPASTATCVQVESPSLMKTC